MPWAKMCCSFAVGVEGQNPRALFLAIVVVLFRSMLEPTETYRVLLSGENSRSARPVPAGMGNIGYHSFRSVARLEVSDAIGEAHDAVRIANVDVLRIRSQRIEGNSERLVQAVRRILAGLAGVPG